MHSEDSVICERTYVLIPLLYFSSPARLERKDKSDESFSSEKMADYYFYLLMMFGLLTDYRYFFGWAMREQRLKELRYGWFTRGNGQMICPIYK